MSVDYLTPKLSPPFLKTPVSLGGIRGRALQALGVIVAGSGLTYGLEALLHFGVVLVGILIYAVIVFRTRRESLWSVMDWLIVACLFVFMLPPELPWLNVTLGFAALIFARQVFGGSGQALFHPVLVANLILMSFNLHSTAVVEAEWPRALLSGGGSAFGDISPLLIIGAGLFLVCKRPFRWGLSLGYIGSLLLLHAVLGIEMVKALLSFKVLFLAFFILSDTVTTPSSKRGRAAFAILAAGLTCFFTVSLGIEQGAIPAILLTQATIPCLDRYFAQRPAVLKKTGRPIWSKPLRSKQTVKIGPQQSEAPAVKLSI